MSTNDGTGLQAWLCNSLAQHAITLFMGEIAGAVRRGKNNELD